MAGFPVSSDPRLARARVAQSLRPWRLVLPEEIGSKAAFQPQAPVATQRAGLAALRYGESLTMAIDSGSSTGGWRPPVRGQIGPLWGGWQPLALALGRARPDNKDGPINDNCSGRSATTPADRPEQLSLGCGRCRGRFGCFFRNLLYPEELRSESFYLVPPSRSLELSPPPLPVTAAGERPVVQLSTQEGR